MPEPHDTIVAVSSPPGRAPRGLIRISGPHAFAILDRLVVWADGTPPRTLARVRLRDPDLPALAARFPAGHSFTGDDAAELQVPGHPALLEGQLQHALADGARLAEPGEFTLRAFLAGRIDLTQAEGISATIAAESDAQLRAATLLRDGGLGELASRLADDLAARLALVEAGIDFTDQEDVVPIGPGALDDALAAMLAELDAVLHRAVPWKALDAIPWVALRGPPSSGKSTLFNALLGRARAVVSPAPGTTRDVLIEPLQWTTDDGRRIEVMLVDLAGLDDADAGTLGRDMQAAALAALARADLVLAVHPAHPLAPADSPAITVRTMADRGGDGGPADLAVSARTGEGLDELRAMIARRLGERAVSLAGDMLALQPRHAAAFDAAGAALTAARRRLASHREDYALPDPEQLAADLRDALDALASLTGQGPMTPDAILGRIFATFCIGK